jgi:c-di-GMP-binding flagellar brake protein YcgR
MAEIPNASGDEASDAHRLPDLLDTRDYEKYVVRGKREILAILRQLQASVSLITAFFDEGKEMLLTSLLGADDDRAVIDFGADHETNRKALNADRIFCVASHEKVRIQFELGRLTEIDYDGGPAFSAPLPRSILRLQRRDFFRLSMPIARPLKCLIPKADADGNSETVEASIVDISGGGLALTVPESLKCERDMEFADCRIDLPEVGTIVMTLRARNVFEVELRNGLRVTRAGCAFVNPHGAMLALIQRYIMKVERERKARESGLI